MIIFAGDGDFFAWETGEFFAEIKRNLSRESGNPDARMRDAMKSFGRALLSRAGLLGEIEVFDRFGVFAHRSV